MSLAFDVRALTLEQKQAFLRQVSQHSLLTIEKMEALHVVLGDDIFFLLHLLAGDEIRFPPQRVLKKIHSGVVSREEGGDGQRC